MKKILVHTCCVACLSYVLKKLKETDFQPVIFYYNPNIHGKDEYENRLKDVQQLAEKEGLEMIIPEYDQSEFYDPITSWLDKKSIKFISDKNRFKRKRCEFCYEFRMKEAIEVAKKKHIRYFTSTLLTSPYQDHEFIDFICSQLAKEFKINFYYQDFRKGYWQGRNFARSHKYMIPTYCGCDFSINERMLE